MSTTNNTQANQNSIFTLEGGLLPADLFTSSSLKVLDIRFNQVVELPSEVKKTTTLQELDLYDNRLSRLPPELALLPNLRVLHIKENPFEDQTLTKMAARPVTDVLEYLRAQGALVVGITLRVIARRL